MSERRSIVLAERPAGHPTEDNFRLEKGPVPEPGEGEVLARILWLSLDPYMRGRMDAAKSYAAPVELGAVMEGGCVGQVLASNDPRYAQGDYVTGQFGWTSHGVLKGDALRKLDPAKAPLQYALGALGMPGLTAWVGINRILEAKTGETVVISAATGAVGSLAGQLAREKGCRVIGVAGGPEKCAHAESELGYDVCLDHHAAADGQAMADRIAEAAPGGVDCYFENVGGKTLDGVLPNMNVGGRIALCGVIAWYSGANLDDATPLPKVWRTILVNRLRVQGFIIFDHFDQFPHFVDEVAPMLADGRVRYREDVTEGLENAPKAFLSMLEGGNFGKTLVKVAD